MSGRATSPTRRGGPWRRSQRGAVAVEFALVLPVLVMLLLGTITAGLAYTRAIGLTNAVREGARFGATGDPGDPAAWADWADDVIDRTRETQFDDGATAADSTTTVCVEIIGATATIFGPRCSTAGIKPPPAPSFPTSATVPTPGVGECIVKVWAARHFEITLGVFDPVEGDMLRYSVARYEREC